MAESLVVSSRNLSLLRGIQSCVGYGRTRHYNFLMNKRGEATGMELLGGAAFLRLENAINAAAMRQRVISNNIANGDTPYFKRSDVVFEEMLTQAIGSLGTRSLAGRITDPRHIPINGSYPSPAPRVVTDESTTINNNRNNVDVEKEQALLAENQLRYNLMAQQVAHEAKMMRIGIQGSV
jgi:flagellar basal-body rod protein FlgB